MVALTTLLFVVPPRFLPKVISQCVASHPKASFNYKIGRSYLYRNFFPYGSCKVIWEDGFDIGTGPYLINAIPHGYLPLPIATMFGTVCLAGLQINLFRISG